MSKTYIKMTQEVSLPFFSKHYDSPMVILNLLMFKKVAGYSEFPLLKPEIEISGSDAYELYAQAVTPLLAKIGSEIIFYGTSDQFLIGPIDKKWDLALLIRHQNMRDFLTFASGQEYLKIQGHKAAAVEDSRLLPIKESH